MAGEVDATFRDRFNKEIKVLGVRVPKMKVSEVTKKLKKHALQKRGVKAIMVDPNDSEWRVWLHKEGGLEAEPDVEVREVMDSIDGATLTEVAVPLSYSHCSQTEVLAALLPEGAVIPHSFEAVGHIAHLNLRDDHMPYKGIIGQVVLDKNPAIRTVVNKVGVINSKFREFQLELLAGEADFEATVKQHGFTFHVPYDKVYWNSRLQTEHTRLVGLLSEGDVFADVMAGVGPFAIPAAAAGYRVLANDLNPVSYESLRKNAGLNGVRVEATCLDGRDFIIAVRDRLLRRGGEEVLPSPCKVHFAMNLPASAVEFLDAFREWDEDLFAVEQVVVHVYCFSSDADFLEDAVRQAEHHLGRPIKGHKVHHVRNVAPRKEMLCVSFPLHLSGQAPAKRPPDEPQNDEKKARYE